MEIKQLKAGDILISPKKQKFEVIRITEICPEFIIVRSLDGERQGGVMDSTNWNIFKDRE